MNILFSTTRQWNPGDEFILFGIRNILDKLQIDYNPIIYNRNPDIRPNACAPLNFKRSEERQQYNHFIRAGVCDNSIKTWIDWSNIDLVIIAGTPEWMTIRCDELYRMVIKYSIPVAFVGVDYINRTSISRVLNKVLKKNIFFSTRNEAILKEMQKSVPNAIYLPCTAIVSALKERIVKRVKRIALVYQGSAELITELAGVDSETYAYQLYIYKKLQEKYPQYEYSIVCHYVDEVIFAEEMGIERICYSYDARDYEKIYQGFDLVISCRIHAVGLAASLGIPSISVIHDFRAGTIKGFEVPEYDLCVSVGDSIDYVFEKFECCVSNCHDISRRIIAKKKEVMEDYQVRFMRDIISEIKLDKKKINYECLVSDQINYFDYMDYDAYLYKMYIKRIILEVLDEIICTILGKKVIIKGAGEHTKKLLPQLDENVLLVGILSNDNTSLEGIEHIEIDRLNEIEYDYVIISSWLYEKEMIEEIMKYVPDNKILSIYEIIEKKGVYLENNIFYYLEYEA